MSQRFSTRTMTAQDWASLAYFKPQEFEHPEKMGWEFCKWLDTVRKVAGCAMPITSSYRTPEHNVAVGGAQDSAHCDDLCQAVDVMPASSADRWAIVQAAAQLGCTRIGVYSNGSIHLDRTEDVRPAPVLWTVVSHPAQAA